MQDGAFVGHETDFSKAALRLIPIPRATAKAGVGLGGAGKVRVELDVLHR